MRLPTTTSSTSTSASTRSSSSRARSTRSPSVRFFSGSAFLITTGKNLEDGCKKTDIILDSVISSVDIVNSQSCKAQINGKAPTVNIDKTDGFQLYLTKEGLNTEVLYAKSSELNVTVPGKTEDADPIETALPEQLLAKWDGAKFGTNFVEHHG